VEGVLKSNFLYQKERRACVGVKLVWFNWEEKRGRKKVCGGSTTKRHEEFQ